MGGYLGNPTLVLMSQDAMPVANFVMPSNPTATINPVRVNVTWFNTTTGCMFVCVDNTTDANVWYLVSGFRGALVYKDSATGNQVIGDSATVDITFDKEAYDTDGFHNNVTDNARLTIPFGVSKVKLGFAVKFASQTTAVGYRYARVQKNNADFIGAPERRIPPQNAIPLELGGMSAIVDVVPGDYFEVQVVQTSGGDLNVEHDNGVGTWFSIEVIR